MSERKIIRDLTLIGVAGCLICEIVLILSMFSLPPADKLEPAPQLELRRPVLLELKKPDIRRIKGETFIPYEITMYATDGAIARSVDATATTTFSLNDEIYISAVGSKNNYITTIDNVEYIISGDDLMETEYISPAQKPSYTYPSGSGKLTRSGGIYFDEWGHRESYYNLDMSYCIAMMRDLGYDEVNYPYWIRDDGCKMLGPYIMIAANFDWYPKGTLLEFSLGTGIVVDTGTFIYEWPDGIDVCVNW